MIDTNRELVKESIEYENLQSELSCDDVESLLELIVDERNGHLSVKKGALKNQQRSLFIL